MFLICLPLRGAEKTFLLIVLMLGLASCMTRQTSSSNPSTILHPGGNEQVAEAFARYEKKSPASRCDGRSRERRVLVTGFGRFFGAEFNISGVVVDSMANHRFWPFQYTHDRVWNGFEPSSSGALDASDSGGRATNRRLMINGVEYQVCFLLVDVIWDLAAAIATSEIQRLEPQLIVMLGRGNDLGVYESWAANKTMEIHGYDATGRIIAENQPVSSSVLPPGEGIQDKIEMTWEHKTLRRATKSMIERMGYKVIAANQPRPINSYICNNVSYTVLHALKGVELILAGGKLVLHPKPLASTKAGFLHLPDRATNQTFEVFEWCKVLATIIDTSFRPES